MGELGTLLWYTMAELPADFRPQLRSRNGFVVDTTVHVAFGATSAVYRY